MIDERFSSAAFEARGRDTEASRELADLLADEIQKEMHEVILVHFAKLVGRLNAIGHALKPEYAPVPGDLSYRDDCEGESGYHCRLRVGFDTVVSVGYAHLISGDDIDIVQEALLVGEHLKKTLSKKRK